MTEPSAPDSARAVAERAAAAYQTLADLAETVEDEWQYVTDLVDAYMPSLGALAGAEPMRVLSAPAVNAVVEAIAEIALITDPHKAIDWLSTFPHVVALAMGGVVDSPAEVAPGNDDESPGDNDDSPGDNDDSPFRALLERGR